MKLLKLSDHSYPHYRSDLERDNPHTWFPSDLNSCDLTKFGYCIPQPTTPPDYDSTTHYPIEESPINDKGVWKQSWKIQELPPVQPPILWSEFKNSLMKSPTFNSYFANILQTHPIIATSLPIAVSNLENKNYNSFLNIWNVLKDVNPPSSKLLEELVNLCISCNLPEDFINNLS